jgi:hypothetical protein
MLKDPSNPLLKTATAAAPVKTNGQPSANETAETETGNDSEKESGNEDEDEEEDPEPPNPAPPESEPAADPSASTTPAKPKLTAFERGALRAVGKGDLIARVERAEMEAAGLTEQVASLKAENTRLAGELSALKKETPSKIEAAAKGRENQVSKGVAAELSALGISKEAAPAALTAESDKTKTRAEFEQLDHPARNAFMRAGGKITE